MGFLRLSGWLRSGLSQALEEGEEGVGWPVAARFSVGWSGASEGAFFDGYVGVEVGVR